MQYCYLWYETLLPPLDTSTVECHFHFGPAVSFFLELLVITLCSSFVAYWTPSNLGGLFSGVISFCLFILFMGFLLQEYCSGLPFPPPVDHVLSELSTRTVHLRWPHTAWLIASLLHKPLHHDKAVICPEGCTAVNTRI